MFRRFLFLVALVLAVPAWAADERAKTDRKSKTHTIIGENLSGEIRKIRTSDTGSLLMEAPPGGFGAVDQGAANATPTIRWNIVWRDSTGAEFAIPANPLAMSIFDGLSNLLGVAANPLTVDLGVNNDIQGDVADDAADTGNPVKEGGVARTGLRTPVADGDRVDASYDKEGRKVTAPHGIRENEVRNEITLTNTTETEVLAAGGAGVFLDVTGILVSNTSNTTLRVLLRDVLSGTVVISPPAASGGGGSAPLMLVPLPQATANSQWTAELSAMPTGGNVKVFLQAVKRQ